MAVSNNIESIFVNQYKNIPKSYFSKIHQIAAYLAMFPPNLPYYFIDNFSKENDLVFDPFSGRGTVAFEACRMGRIGIGGNLNPLAVCLTKSKTNLPKFHNVKKDCKIYKIIILH